MSLFEPYFILNPHFTWTPEHIAVFCMFILFMTGVGLGIFNLVIFICEGIDEGYKKNKGEK